MAEHMEEEKFELEHEGNVDAESIERTEMPNEYHYEDADYGAKQGEGAVAEGAMEDACFPSYLRNPKPKPQRVLQREADWRQGVSVNSERQVWKAKSSRSSSAPSPQKNHKGSVDWSERHHLTFCNEKMQKNIRSYFDRFVDFKDSSKPFADKPLKPTWQLSMSVPSEEEREEDRRAMAFFSALSQRELNSSYIGAKQKTRMPRADASTIYDRLYLDALAWRGGPKPPTDAVVARTERPLPGGGGGIDVRHGPQPRSPDVIRVEKSERRATEVKEAAEAKDTQWNDRHHHVWSNEMNLRLPYKEGTGKILNPLVLRSYFDRTREPGISRSEDPLLDPPRSIPTVLPVWRLEPMGAPWRQQAASAAAAESCAWHAAQASRSKSVGGEVSAGLTHEPLDSGALGVSTSVASSSSPLRARRRMRNPDRPYLPSPGGAGSPCPRLVEPPPPGLPDNGRGLPLTKEAELRRQTWHSRHHLVFHNEEVSRLDRSYFDRWRDPAALSDHVKKMKGEVSPRTTKAWSLDRSEPCAEEARKVRSTSDLRHQASGTWDPRHSHLFCNDIQKNLRSYFDRPKEVENEAGASINEVDLPSAADKVYTDCTISRLRGQRSKVQEEDKLRIDWKIPELSGKVDATTCLCLRETSSEGSLQAFKERRLEARRLRDLERRGRKQEAQLAKNASRLNLIREKAWFSSHDVHF